MKATSLVQARIDPLLKEKAESYFHSFGIDTATAIRIFYAKVAETGRIPFTIGLDSEDVYDAKLAETAFNEFEKSGSIKSSMSKLYQEFGIQ